MEWACEVDTTEIKVEETVDSLSDLIVIEMTVIVEEDEEVVVDTEAEGVVEEDTMIAEEVGQSGTEMWRGPEISDGSLGMQGLDQGVLIMVEEVETDGKREM